MTHITIPFGGFYASIHDTLIGCMLENYFNGEDYSELDINYDLIHLTYINRYLELFQEFVEDHLNISIVKFHNIRLNSPQYYNFETDTISTSIANATATRLTKKFYKNSEFLTWLTDATESYDGYVSFYTLHDVLNNKDDMLIQYILKYICETIFTTDVYLEYYERNNISEILYDIEIELAHK